ncbi:MAG: LysR family transcriptional regulator [Clostridia bacterium]|nr:LysR family transcriptional regulator [Clostridia bacterium]
MNILHMKYAAEVAKAGSINKASEILLIAQPNLSRSIKELEADLGITIFDRSAKGMVLTPEGEEFINYANAILKQINSVEQLYKNGVPIKQRFSVSVPRATYISEAFAQFSKNITSDTAELFYKETNSSRTIKNVLSDGYKLGIVRYAENYDKYFKSMFDEKGLTYEMIAEFRYVILMSKDSPLASLPEIHFSDLDHYISIAHADPYVPTLPTAQVRREELPDTVTRRIFIFERASQFDILSENPQTYMWVSPIPPQTLERYGLTQRICCDNERLYKDFLIYRNDYKLTKLDKQFITEVCMSKRKYLEDILF